MRGASVVLVMVLLVGQQSTSIAQRVWIGNAGGDFGFVIGYQYWETISDNPSMYRQSLWGRVDKIELSGPATGIGV
jgi:hypothetical protein